MALSDMVEVIAEVVDLRTTWRFFLAATIGGLFAWGLVELLGPSSVTFLLAGIIGAAGLCLGVVWQWRR